MPVAPSFNDLLTQGKAEAQARRPDLLFNDGDITQAMLHGGGAMADAIIRFAAQAFRATFIDGADGDALTALVDDHLNLQRSPATAAQVTISFSRTLGGAGGTIPAGFTVSSDFDAAGARIQFTTNAAIVVAAGQVGSWSVVATAVIAGRDGNVAAGLITKAVDALFDTFTVTNPSSAAGGNNIEPDEDLRTRARLFFSTLRRGTLAALEFGALQVPSVRTAVATEVLASGLATVTISDSDGNSTAQMIMDVQTELENWRCAGVNVNVVGGARLVVNLTVLLTVRAGFDKVATNALFVSAITARMNKLRAGETLTLDMIIAAGISVSPDDVSIVAFVAIAVNGVPQSLTADIAATASQVIRPGAVVVT